MLYLSLYFFFLLQTITAAATTPPYTPTDFILLNCGSLTSSKDQSNRNWEGDNHSKYASSTSSSAHHASFQDSSVNTIPYMTARLFHSKFTYIFPVVTGSKFIRLYFYPNTYSNFNTSSSFFSVSVNNFTLLKNFSANLNVEENPSFMKEYLINVKQNQSIHLTFSPNQNSFAFINGIEIISVPDKLYFKGNDVPIKSINQPIYLNDENTVLENLYRLNVGGANIEIQDDTNMFRAWHRDDDYIFGSDFGYTPYLRFDNFSINYTATTPPCTAPKKVYTTSRTMRNTSIRLEWSLPVDSGFYYLHRFHFCEIQLEITLPNERVFTIKVDNEVLDIVDVVKWTGSNYIPIYKDYIKWVPDKGRHGRKELHLSLAPVLYMNPLYSNVLLNGLEIFKLSNTNRSLAAVNPQPSSSVHVDHDVHDVGESTDIDVLPEDNNESKKLKKEVMITVVITFIIAAISYFTFCRSRQEPMDSGSRNDTKPPRKSGSGSSLPINLCRHFSLDEMKSATHNFDDNFVIGKGGFGNVYQGCIDGATCVAIERLNTSSNQGVQEFLAEINMLSMLRHLHLVSLLGYCDENREMILVYEYMANGTLREHLYNSENHSLTWKQRLQICTDAAKGLHYLHTSAKYTIIHRDVKSTNILLDEKWVAKISDFGLSRVGPTNELHTHVSTMVKGTFGYLDPEYYKRQQLTEKSDVYSFGVVLFEVLCARPVIIPSLEFNEKVNLAEWAKFCNKNGTLEETIIDTNLKGKIAPECLNIYVVTALKCLKDKGSKRPAMSDILQSLELAMQLQEAAEKRDMDHTEDSVGIQLDEAVSRSNNEESLRGSSEAVSISKNSTGFLSSAGEVFTEIQNPLGR